MFLTNANNNKVSRLALDWLMQLSDCNKFTVITVTFNITSHKAPLFCPFNCDFGVCVSGLVGSAYYLVAFQPDSAVAALQRATTTTVTMGEYSHYQFILSTHWCVVYSDILRKLDYTLDCCFRKVKVLTIWVLIFVNISMTLPQIGFCLISC